MVKTVDFVPILVLVQDVVVVAHGQETDAMLFQFVILAGHALNAGVIVFIALFLQRRHRLNLQALLIRLLIAQNMNGVPVAIIVLLGFAVVQGFLLILVLIMDVVMGALVNLLPVNQLQ